MEKNVKLLKYCFKQMINIRVFLALCAALFLHVAFNQFNVVDYILYFEGSIPFIFSIVFLEVIDVTSKNGMLNFENKVQMSRFKIYYFRYISCFLISIIFFVFTYLEYAALFLKKINIYQVAEIDGITYSNIGVLKIFFVFVISLLIMSKLFIFINILTGNKFISLVILFLFVITNLVYKNLPFNFMSLYFHGIEWLPNKIIWIIICVILEILIYIRYKACGNIIKD